MKIWLRWMLMGTLAGSMPLAGCGASGDPAETELGSEDGADPPATGGGSSTTDEPGAPSTGDLDVEGMEDGVTPGPTDGDGQSQARPGETMGTPDSQTPGAPAADLVRVTDDCVENRDFIGQMFKKDDEPNHGGKPVTEPYAPTYDAGIEALYAMMPAEGESAGVDLDLTDATVTATTFGKYASRTFWIQDGKSAVAVRLEEDVSIDGAAALVKVGSRVSGRITGLKNYFGSLQVESGTDWSFSATEQPVYVDDRTGATIDAGDVGTLTRVTGVLTGAPSGCGGSARCWMLDFAGTSEVIFRSSSTFLDTGACVTFVGPVSLFDGEPQLNTDNFSWLWTND